MDIKGLVGGMLLVSIMGCSVNPITTEASKTTEEPKVSKVCVEEPARTGSNMKKRTCKTVEQQSTAK